METPLTMVNDQPKLGFLSRLVGLFTGPGRVFAWLSEKPDFIWPVIFLLISLGFSLSVKDFLLQVMIETFPKYAETLAKAPSSLSAGMLAVSAFSMLLYLVTSAFFYWLLAKMAGGERIRFSAAMSIIGYIQIVNALQSVFLGGVFLATGTYPPLGLEANMELSKRLFTTQGQFLSQINPFTVYWLFLTWAALKKGFKLTGGKATVITIISWIVGLLLTVGMSAMQFQNLK
ncbi:MAG: YIP1 family protein [Firmicutes bacterium]|nr:YIP1 family protein [Bacillota bacterium]